MKILNLKLKTMFNYLLVVLFIFCSANCNDKKDDSFIREFEESTEESQTLKKSPLFENSIVSTDIDFIKATDPDAFLNLEYVGQSDKEMPDKRTDNLFDTNTYVFKANFSGNKTVEIWAHSSFGSLNAAQSYAEKLTSRLGKLPSGMRGTLSHVIIHKGDEGAFAEDQGRFFVLYSDNMDTRISNNDLEETVFHETVHVAFDLIYAESTAWKQAQTQDGVFITNYAESRPVREDLAESAIFGYTLIHHPDRLTPEVQQWIQSNIPNRFAILKTIFE